MLQRNCRMPVRCRAHDSFLPLSRVGATIDHKQRQRPPEPFDDANAAALKSSGIDENISGRGP
jgi:hypothetical protein